MIAVIADDLTGAAEIGGIALRHGLRVVMDTKVHGHTDMDVLVVATDARSKSVEEATAIMGDVTQRLLQLHPEVIFKKTDSLLRGHVGEELTAQMRTSGKKRVLLIPANPALKRTIRNGIYYANDVPLNQSHLADAARNKIKNSGVLYLLGEKFKPLSRVISLGEDMPEEGFIIGNTYTEADLDNWAQQLTSDIIPAGSGGFFNALLKSRVNGQKRKAQDEMIVGKKIIYVCGSAFPLSKATVAEARTDGRNVAYMPPAIFCPGTERQAVISEWAKDIVAGLQNGGAVIVAIDQLQCTNLADLSNQVRQTMAMVIEKVMQLVEVDELVIEGGATASSIIDQLRYERFFPAQELSQGVIRMKVQEANGLYLTMKPGSYQWPSSIWKSA